MGSKWNKYKLDFFVDVNPTERLPKGNKAKKVSMDKITTASKRISGFEYSEVVGGARFKNGDTLLPKITPCLENGKIGFVDILGKDEIAFGSTEFTVLRSNKNSDPHFVYYFAKSPLFHKTAICLMEGTSGRKRVNERALASCKFLIPDLPTQRAIARVLSQLDEKIELNRKINAELENMAKTIYDYWFLQFDFPNAEGKPYKSSGGEMVYNPTLKRGIPKGWTVENLRNTKLCKLIKAGINVFEGEKIYIATSDIEGEEIINDSEKTDFENRLSRANMQPILNSVWFAKMKATTKNLLLNKASENIINNYILSTGLSGLNCSENALYYLWNYVTSEYFSKKKDLVSSGATQQAINESDLSSFNIIEPNQNTLIKFANLVEPIYVTINSNKQQNKHLAELCDFLLPLLMNGQVTVEKKA